VSNRDFGFILEEWLQPLPNLVAQEWIEGRPANFTVACWEGQTLAGIGVEVVASHGEKGASVIVEVVEGTEMMHAAKSIAKRLRLSGFYGLDFMIALRPAQRSGPGAGPRSARCVLLVSGGKAGPLAEALHRVRPHRPLPGPRSL
jgi:hypothetical protein